MKKLTFAVAAALGSGCIALSACDAGESAHGDATGGTVSTSGGATSTGGTTSATGGTSSTGGGMTVTARPFPFPQNKKPAYCNLTTVAGASDATRAAYTDFKNRLVVAGSPGVRVQRDRNGGDTVSEGIAYGMLAALYMADQATFDGLWTYAKAHLDAKGLMNWHITSSGQTAADGAGSATDADLDMAWALLGAAQQWGSSAYFNDGKGLVDKIFTHEIGSDGMLRPGDGWGATAETFPDYFSPAYFRLFAQVSNNPYWTSSIMDRNYEILKNSAGTKGLVPDKTTNTYEPPANAYYYYDACRTPWRIAMDYCFNGEPRAKAYLDLIGAFFNGIGAANIVDGYDLNGNPRGNVKNMAFIGPAGVAGMAGYPKLLDDAFTFGVSGGSDSSYYPQSLKVLTMMMMSGNFTDFSK